MPFFLFSLLGQLSNINHQISISKLRNLQAHIFIIVVVYVSNIKMRSVKETEVMSGFYYFFFALLFGITAKRKLN